MPIADKFYRLVAENREDLQERFGVRHIGIFGSCVRGEDSVSSDIDVLVDFERKTFDNYMDLKFFLEEKLGRRVDVVIIDTLKPALKETVLSEVRYAA